MIELQALLNRNPLKRLGSNGGNEVKSHPFFGSINWDDLYNRKVKPPFEPCKNGNETEATNFEKEFTVMPLCSVDETMSNDAKRLEAESFLNFTYEEESYLEVLRDNLAASRRK